MDSSRVPRALVQPVWRRGARSIPSTTPSLDTTDSVGPRAAGCVFGFVAFILILTASDHLRRSLPSLAVQLGAVFLGGLLIHTYRTVGQRRWGVAMPDAVQVMAHDVSSFARKRAADYRLTLPSTTPTSDRILHELLYALKWVGHLMVFAGLGTLLYSLMVRLGIVSVPTVS
jgi:hypothetical protein